MYNLMYNIHMATRKENEMELYKENGVWTKDIGLNIRIDTRLLDRIDNIREAQLIKPPRSETVRMLIGIGLEAVEAKNE